MKTNHVVHVVHLQQKHVLNAMIIYSIVVKIVKLHIGHIINNIVYQLLPHITTKAIKAKAVLAYFENQEALPFHLPQQASQY
jgi:hypothetical protein